MINIHPLPKETIKHKQHRIK